MSTKLTLSEAQLDFVEELLRREQKQLLIEIRHTDAAAYREGLRQRLAVADTVMDEIESAAPRRTSAAHPL